MKIVQLVDHHSENMGYSDVCLSKSFSKLGDDVFVISSNFKANYNQKNFHEVYNKFHSSKIENFKSKKINGYTLHRLKCIKTPFGLYFLGLYDLLKNIRPDVIQVGEATSFLIFQAVIYKFFLKYLLTVECHIHLSVYSPAKKFKDIYQNQKLFFFIKFIINKVLQKIYKFLVSKILILKIDKCYPISKDAFFIATKYLGYAEKKTQISYLGTDIELFNPKIKKNIKLKEKLGFKKNNFVCIYTGRLDESKSPHLMSQAVKKLNDEGHKNVRGLFIGNGNRKYLKKIKNKYCKIISFVDYKDLPQYFRISEIGIWPTQESTSQLDALACGLPIIINENTGTPERIKECGLLYKINSVSDLANKIVLLMDNKKRKLYSKNAIALINKKFSWIEIAKSLKKDYKKLISNQNND